MITKEEMMKYRGKVWGYRGDGYPLVESGETRLSIILTEYKVKPEIEEEVEFEILITHGNIANARRVGDLC